MPGLKGLVQETANKSTLAMEHCIQSLKDQLKAVQGKKSPKISKGDGTKKTSQRILKNKDTPVASNNKKKKSAPSDPNATSNGTASAKGKKKKGGWKVSFEGKQAMKLTKSRK